MAEEPDDLLLRLMAAGRESDLFRVIVRGFGVFEDLLEREIDSLLAEPLEGLRGGPFRHKLNLAIGLGIIDPGLRRSFMQLASLRHGLAHADREPEDVTAEELEEIRAGLDPERAMHALLKEGTEITPAVLASLVIIAAYVQVDVAAGVVRKLRDQEREAHRREIEARALPTSMIRDLLLSWDDPTTAQDE